MQQLETSEHGNQSVCGSHLPIHTFHTVRQCQVYSVDCVAPAIIITSPQLFIIISMCHWGRHHPGPGQTATASCRKRQIMDKTDFWCQTEGICQPQQYGKKTKQKKTKKAAGGGF